VIGGFYIRNSEIGFSSVQVLPRIFRLVCSNGMVVEDMGPGLRQIHVSYEDDDRIYEKIKSAVRKVYDSFDSVVNRLRVAAKDKIDDPKKAIHNVVKKYSLSKEQEKNILIAFGEEPDRTKYGIINAVTRTGQSKNYEKNTDMECLGGKLLFDSEVFS
jgi:hypothetical protein